MNLFIVSTTGTGLRQLTDQGGSQPAPCANGTIAFVKHGYVYLLGRDRRSQRRIHRGFAPSCSPDSRQIAFVRKGAVYTIASSGKQLHRLTAGGNENAATYSIAYYTAYSPDGHEIALLYDNFNGASTTLGLEVVNLRGRQVRPNMGLVYSGSFDELNGFGAAGISWQPLPRGR